MTKSEETNDARPRVWTAMALAVLALSFASIFITKLETSEVQPLVIAFYRMSISTILLLPWALIFNRDEILSLAKKDFSLLMLGGLCLAIHFGAWITSLKFIPIATSVVIVNSHPLFVVIASYFFLGERLARKHLIGTVIGLAGMLVMSRDAFADFQLALKGDALAVAGALAVVGYFIVGRKARVRMSLLGYVTPVYAACSVFLLIGVLAAGDSLAVHRASSWAYLSALAIVPTILGHTLFNWAIKHVRPTAISIAFLAEPVVASLLALMFFDQRPPLGTLLGGVFVLAGVYLTTLKQPE